MDTSDEILELLSQVKSLAKRYKDLTGKPLGVTGEVAEYSAAKILGLELAVARQSGYDATKVVDGKIKKYQIKGRCLSEKPKPGQRIGRLPENLDCDFVLLVLLDEELEARKIYEAKWTDVDEALKDKTIPSGGRNIWRQLPMRKFIAIGAEVWSRNTLSN